MNFGTACNYHPSVLSNFTQFQVDDAPVVVEDALFRVEDDGLVQIPQCPALVTHLDVGTGQVVVRNRVPRLHGDGLGKVLHGAGQVSKLVGSECP